MLPERPRLDLVRQEIKQRLVKLEDDFLTVAELIAEAVEGKYYQSWGYLDPEDYFREELGFSPRTIWKRLAVLRAWRTLPPEDAGPARAALAQIGPAKAAIIAPAIQQGMDWRVIVQEAADHNEEMLQARVSSVLGLRPRGNTLPLPPGEQTYRYLHARMPDEESRLLLEQFRLAGRRKTGSENFVGTLIAAMQECLGSWI